MTSNPFASLNNLEDDFRNRPTEQTTPIRPGWWARIRNGRIEWFMVNEIESDDGRGDSGNSQLMIWASSIEDFLPIQKFCSPLTKWFGPFLLPTKWSLKSDDT